MLIRSSVQLKELIESTFEKCGLKLISRSRYVLKFEQALSESVKIIAAVESFPAQDCISIEAWVSASEVLRGAVQSRKVLNGYIMREHDGVAMIRDTLDFAKASAVSDSLHADYPELSGMWLNLSYDPHSGCVDQSQWHFYVLTNARVQGASMDRTEAFLLAVKECARFGDKCPSIQRGNGQVMATVAISYGSPHARQPEIATFGMCVEENQKE